MAGKVKKKKILFIGMHRPERSPSQRFRFEQYLDYLNNNGFHCEQSFLISEKDDKFFYKPGNISKKIWVIIKSFLKRFNNVLKASSYDIIFVQREAFMTGTTFFERSFSKKSKLVFDFDDSIWLSNVSDANKKFNWLKNPSKTSDIIKISDLIFAGNQYLADYAGQFNKNVVIIPTTIDTEEYKRVETDNLGKTVIGWSGSITTIQHFEFAIPFLEKIKAKYGDRVEIKVIGDGSYVNEKLGVKGLPWIKEDEVKELSSFDIGIMPLPDDEWAKGKCGLKGLQYMALSIPTIMSPVGVNSEIIQSGENGYLATKEDEWVLTIEKLIEDKELRLKIGAAGRKTVEDEFSIESQKNRYKDYFLDLISK